MIQRTYEMLENWVFFVQINKTQLDPQSVFLFMEQKDGPISPKRPVVNSLYQGFFIAFSIVLTFLNYLLRWQIWVTFLLFNIILLILMPNTSFYERRYPNIAFFLFLLLVRYMNERIAQSAKKIREREGGNV